MVRTSNGKDVWESKIYWRYHQYAPDIKLKICMRGLGENKIKFWRPRDFSGNINIHGVNKIKTLCIKLKLKLIN